MDIISLLKSPEGKTLEFKRDLSSPMSVLRAIVAFANTAGGTLIIGVEDKEKRICGVDNPWPLEEKLANLINDLVAPQLLPEIEVVPWRNTYLLTAQIFPSSTKPHYLKQQGMKKGSYIRVGSTNRLVDETMLAELQRVKFEDSFDKEPMPALNSEAIDFRVASELFSKIRQLKKSDVESMDLVTSFQAKKVPTHGGMILFGKERLHYFSDAWIQVGRFLGETKTHIFDTRNITSPLIIAIDEAMEFVKKHSMRSLEIKDTRHVEKWSFPLTAIREALINAVVHADYSQRGSPIRLAIFDDRIEIENPGLLLFGLTIEEVKRGVSKLRNRVIGQVFYRLGLIERWGSGIKRMTETCQELGLPEPLLEEIGTHFRVTLFTQPMVESTLNELDQLIVTLLKKSQGLSTKEISMFIQKSPRATRTRLMNLIKQGLVVEIGHGPNDPKRKYWIK